MKLNESGNDQMNRSYIQRAHIVSNANVHQFFSVMSTAAKTKEKLLSKHLYFPSCEREIKVLQYRRC